MVAFHYFFVGMICLIAACFVETEGEMSISQELTVYAKQSLTMTCRPKDCPPNYIYWYKHDRRNTSQEDMQLHIGPTYTIPSATSKDTALYLCSGTEWGIWGIHNYIMVNVIEPGEASCASGWSLHKHACYMHYDKQLDMDWHWAEAFCRNVSSATLVKIADDSDANFIRDLTKYRNTSTYWVGLSRDANGSFHWSDGSPVWDVWGDRAHNDSNKLGEGRDKCAVFRRQDRGLIMSQCAGKRPIICQRDLPEAPRRVMVESVTSSTAKVTWQASSSSPSRAGTKTFYVECTTPSGKFVSRSSSVEASLLLTNLRPNTQYKVRVQAENMAGNGSSSPYVSFTTKDSPPSIVTSAPNGEVSVGESVALKCVHSSKKITWYKDNSDAVIDQGPVLHIFDITAKDEGTYHCAVNDGIKGSTNIAVIEPPLITGLNGVLLEQDSKGDETLEALLVCKTTNRHPPVYAWSKDGAPLASRGRLLKVSLKRDEAFGKYECQASNLAGTATRSLVISPMVKKAEPSSYFSLDLIAIITGALSLLLICCVAIAVLRILSARRKKRARARKFTAQESSTEMVAIESPNEPNESRQVESRTEDVTRDQEDVFVYDVVGAWSGTNSNGTYMSLRRDNVPEYPVEATQARKPDYTNISPSNRNDSAANCMYAPLKLTGFKPKARSYENMDSSASSDK